LYSTSAYGVRKVEDYLETFGDLPDELAEWLKHTDWIKLRNARTVDEVTETAMAETVATENPGGDFEEVPGAPMDKGDSGVEVSGASKDKEDSGEDGLEEISALWVELELGDVMEDDFDADAWSEVGRM
jgi:hypothetical protein